jgi:hypothetical protein
MIDGFLFVLTLVAAVALVQAPAFSTTVMKARPLAGGAGHSRHARSTSW